MAGRGAAGPSRQELIRRGRQSGFVGRREQIAGFRAALEQPREAAEQFLFHVRGPAGVGKSTLVRQLEAAATAAGAVTVYADESVTDALELMETVAAALARSGPALRTFERRLAEYRRLRHEAAAGLVRSAAEPEDGGAGAQAGPAPSALALTGARLGLVGLGLVPGAGAFAGALDPAQLAAGADRVRALLSARQRGHEDLSLVLEPLAALTPVFLEDLAEAARERPWLVWFLDTYERTGPALDAWLRDVLITGRYGELPGNVLAVLAGQSPLAPGCWGDYQDLVTDWPLEVFTDREARDLLTARGVVDERVVRMILDLSGRLPVLVTTLAQNRPTDVAELGDPSGTAVERFLRWVPGPAHREAVLTCALARELDEDVYRAAAGEEAAGPYAWLRAQPFVTDRSGRCRYHEVVRAPMLRLRRRQSPARWRADHERLAAAFRARREALGSGWRDERWREHRLEETYHLLCADPRGARLAAVREVLTAYDEAPRGASLHWARTLAQAGRDAGDAALARTGAELLAAYEESETGALSWLLAHGALDTAGRALALSLRGREYRDLERFAEALADYDEATVLDPGLDWAWSGRGRTYLAMDRYEEALADFDRALELSPDIPVIVGNRGEALRLLGRAEEAARALTRALALDPGFAWAWAGKGAALRLLGRYEEAVPCLDRAVALRPEYAWAYQQRGLVHRLLEHFEQALEDHDRAVGLSPENARFHVQRGITLRFLGRQEEAFAEFDRGVGLRPQDGWGLAQRGEAYWRSGDTDRALADLRRAVELDGGYLWARVTLSDVLLASGRADEALAELDGALAVSSGTPWVLTRRALLHRAAGRPEEALADLGRALDLDGENDLALTVRSSLLVDLGRLPEALADLDRTLRVRPRSVPDLMFRGRLLRVLDRPGAALADFGRVLALEPGHTEALTARAGVHRLVGRHREAVADLTRVLGHPSAEDPGVLVSRAESLRRLGRYEEALRDLGRALRLAPDSATGLLCRGLVRLARNEQAAAVADFAEAARLAPLNGWHAYCLALALRRSAPRESAGRLAHAVGRFTVDAAAAGPTGLIGSGNLVLASCVSGRQEEARERLTGFLALAPPAHRLAELVHDLTELTSLFGFPAGPLLPHRARLAQAVEAAATRPATD
ncbi:tetratricopeptide repeat protein [Streptomyces sp. NPDC007088]|uniref:tetratricopeptide repeat protein n=1 Tax=Streptomyces sp. NPDC007088 TaxID=3364773 RepID=UPI00369FA850